MLRHQDTYKYCTACRAELRSEGAMKVCPHCGKHYFFNPKPTVGIILSNSNGEILLTKRAIEPFMDWWDTPGGFVEQDETLEDAIRRELKEETGLEVAELQYAASHFENYEYQGEILPLVATMFTGVVKDGTVEVRVADDVSNFKFVTRAEIDVDHIAFDKQRELIRNLLGK